MPQQRKSRSQKRKCWPKKQRGGDAAAWASAVYGSAGNQTSIPGTNLIAANNLSGVNMCGGVASNAAPVMVGGAADTPVVVPTAPVVPAIVVPSPVAGPAAGPASAPLATAGMVKGGRRNQRRQQRGGKGILTDVAVPAVLLYANQVIKPRKTMVKKSKSKKNYSKKYRK
jgi:hypothetical protein